VIDNAPFGAHLYELQPNGGLVLIGANRSADRILGIRHHPLVGKTIEEAFPGLAEQGIPDTYRTVALTGVPFERTSSVTVMGKLLVRSMFMRFSHPNTT